MPNEAQISTWKTYQAAWAANLSPAERQDLLTSSITDDCIYSDPRTRCSGRAELLAHIVEFRQGMPDVAFQNHTFRPHHAQSLAEWVLYDAQGAVLQPGTSYAQFGPDGRLTLVTGFFGPAQEAA